MDVRKVKKLKLQARVYASKNNETLPVALDCIAKRHGCKDWSAMLSVLRATSPIDTAKQQTH